MQKYGGVKGYFHAFLNSTLDSISPKQRWLLTTAYYSIHEVGQNLLT